MDEMYIARELQKNKPVNRISKELGRRYKHVMRIAHILMEREDPEVPGASVRSRGDG